MLRWITKTQHCPLSDSTAFWLNIDGSLRAVIEVHTSKAWTSVTAGNTWNILFGALSPVIAVTKCSFFLQQKWCEKLDLRVWGDYRVCTDVCECNWSAFVSSPFVYSSLWKVIRYYWWRNEAVEWKQVEWRHFYLPAIHLSSPMSVMEPQSACINNAGTKGPLLLLYI